MLARLFMVVAWPGPICSEQWIMKTMFKKPTRVSFTALVGALVLGFVISLFVVGFNRITPDAAAGQAKPARQVLDKPAAKLPVILLTGFEPFGKSRPPNPSWEAIKDLDGREWKGCRLVCKQVPVVWGAPLEHLPAWISEYQPVAIFSFGQGGSGSFALESKASNVRNRKSVDNRGQRRPTRTIVANGPEYLHASVNCEKFARVLSAKGYPARVSTAAGRYLCEEALYSLEYLKSRNQVEGTVMFCHVPPPDTEIGAALRVLGGSTLGLLGSGLGQGPHLAASSACLGKRLRGKPVTVEYIQQFVKDTLETWHALYQTETSADPAEQPRANDPRLEEIKEFIGRYFRTWSNQDMKGYDACFLPDASVQFLDPRGRLETYSRPQFIADQRAYHQRAAQRATEVAESMDVRFEAKLARVVVFWKLTAGPRIETGYDHFTLLKHEGNWRIVNLVFYPSAKKISD
jgi:pyroglutamyl-peptidase